MVFTGPSGTGRARERSLLEEKEGPVKETVPWVVGYFAVIPRQPSFFVAGKDRRVHARNKKLVFLVSRQTISTTRNAKIAHYRRNQTEALSFFAANEQPLHQKLQP